MDAKAISNMEFDDLTWRMSPHKVETSVHQTRVVVQSREIDLQSSEVLVVPRADNIMEMAKVLPGVLVVVETKSVLGVEDWACLCMNLSADAEKVDMLGKKRLVGD